MPRLRWDGIFGGMATEPESGGAPAAGIPEGPPARLARLPRGGAWLQAILEVNEVVTRDIVALVVTGMFCYLAWTKEVSGDSFTNVMFVVMGYLFGTSGKKTESTIGSGSPTSAPGVPNQQKLVAALIIVTFLLKGLVG